MSTTRTARAIGMTGTGAYWLPVLQSAALGVIFVAISLLGYHAPMPREAPVEVLGSAAEAVRVQQLLDAEVPGGYALTPVESKPDGLAGVTAGRSFAMLELGSPTVLTYAGANGPTVTSALLRDIGAVAGASQSTLVPRDTLPLGPNDSAGLPVFYLVFGVVLASYLFAVTSVAVGSSLSARGHWSGAGILAVILGVLATLIARFVTVTIESRSLTVMLLLTLTSLGVSSGTWLCLRASARYGSLLASVVMVVLGSASGGLVPGAWLPAWLAVFRPVLPMGAGLTGIRDTIYFDGHLLPRELAVLALWAVVPIALGRWISSRSASARAGQGPDGGPIPTP